MYASVHAPSVNAPSAVASIERRPSANSPGTNAPSINPLNATAGAVSSGAENAGRFTSILSEAQSGGSPRLVPATDAPGTVVGGLPGSYSQQPRSDTGQLLAPLAPLAAPNSAPSDGQTPPARGSMLPSVRQLVPYWNLALPLEPGSRESPRAGLQQPLPGPHSAPPDVGALAWQARDPRALASGPTAPDPAALALQRWQTALARGAAQQWRADGALGQQSARRTADGRGAQDTQTGSGAHYGLASASMSGPSGAPAAPAAGGAPAESAPSAPGADPLEQFTNFLTRYTGGDAPRDVRIPRSDRERAERHDLDNLSAALFDRRILVSHLNAVLRALNMSGNGLKAEKQRKLVRLAQLTFSNKDWERFDKIKRAIFAALPPALQSSWVPPPAHLGGAGVAPPAGAASRARAPPSEPGAVNPLAGRAVLQFRPSPFYRLVTQVCDATPLASSGMRSKMDGIVSFALDAAALRRESNQRLLLLCQEFRATPRPQPIAFPFYTEIFVDSERVSANTRGVRGCVGSTKPVDLTPALRAASQTHEVRVVGHITDQNASEKHAAFRFAVYKATAISQPHLLNELRARPRIPADVTRRMAVQAAVGDEDIVSADAVYSLRDKVTMTRIEVPVRTRQCKHIDCFDAGSYLMLQAQAETWKCPVCNNSITWESLAVDEFFNEILARVEEDAESVVVRPDGSWAVHAVDDGDSGDSGDEKPKVKQEIEVVDLLSDSDTEATADEAPRPPPCAASALGNTPTAAPDDPNAVASADLGDSTDPAGSAGALPASPAVPASPARAPAPLDTQESLTRSPAGSVASPVPGTTPGFDSSRSGAQPLAPAQRLNTESEISEQWRAFRTAENMMFPPAATPESSGHASSSPPSRENSMHAARAAASAAVAPPTAVGPAPVSAPASLPPAVPSLDSDGVIDLTQLD